LLPILSKDGFFIIKVGYTKDLNARYKELLSEHQVSNMYLIYAQIIKCEPIENNLHKILQTSKNVTFYPIAKMKTKKVESSVVCIETYIFNYSTLKTIILEVYKMESVYESNILDKKITLTNINIKLKDKEIELKDKDIELKDKEIELAQINSNKEIELAKINSNKEIEVLKLQFDILKLQFELAKLNKS
jgi:hypothetical protein